MASRPAWNAASKATNRSNRSEAWKNDMTDRSNISPAAAAPINGTIPT